MNDSDELKRVLDGPRPGEQPSGIIARIEAECPIGAAQSLQKITEVWSAALRQPDPSRVALQEWRGILPTWFVEQFGPEITREEAIRRRGLPLEERKRLGEVWSLGAWVHWLKPSERQWSWWNAEIVSPTKLQVEVVANGVPFPSGSLQWLLRASGATSVTVLP